MGENNELWRLGAVEAAAQIRSKAIKPSELMRSVVERGEATNGHLNAITVPRFDDAIEEAEAADAAVAGGRELGPLHGVPVTIKENVDIAGLKNTNGVPAFADVTATEDAPLVRNLRNAGAIIIGQTNTPEFSMRGTTDNPLRGRTYNPWNDQISPGGSSGGAGSACAAGIGPLHHGNDIGGSLRFPSMANGTATIKPTSFRVPVYNSSAAGPRGPLAQITSVQGIITRHAADVRLAMQTMITPDPRDPLSPPIPWTGPDLGKPKVALTKETAGYAMHPGIEALVDRAADQLRDAGYDVVEVAPPPVINAHNGWFSTLITELKELLAEPLHAYGSQTLINIFDWYFELSDLQDFHGYMRGFGARTDLMREWNLFMNEYPLVLTPFLMSPMYDWDYDAQGADAVKDMFDSAIYSTGINYLGLPAGVIGMDLVEERPAAIQIVGQYYREDVICDALEAIESRNGVLTHRLWASE